MVFRVGQPTAESAVGPEFGRGLAARTVAALRRALQGRLSPAQETYLSSLSQEADPELLAKGLLHLAGRAEASDHLEAATALYHWFESEECPKLLDLQAQARRRLEAIEGGGAVGARAEFLLSRFVREAADPSTLFAMGAAGALFRTVRFASLARLGATESGLLTRGLGARALSSFSGFAVEATAFPLLHRLADAAMGGAQPGEPRSTGRDIVSSFLTLGALRLCGGVAGAAIRRAPFAPQAFQQAAMLGGILLGQSLEAKLGLRESPAGANSLVEALAMLLQFNVAGNLAGRAFGRGFQAWEKSLELQTEALQRVPPLQGGSIRGLAMAMASTPESRVSLARPFETGSDFQAKMNGTCGTKVRKSPEAEAQLVRLLKRRPVKGSEKLLENFSESEEWIREDGQPSIFGRIVPALLHEVLMNARLETDPLRREADRNEVHALTEALARIVDQRFPENGKRSELQAEFAGQVEDLRRSLWIDSFPLELTYPPEVEAAWRRVEEAWRQPDYYEGSREELARRRPDPDDVDAIWLYQAKDYARRLAIEPEIVDVGALRGRIDPDLLERALAELGERGGEGSLARQLVRVHYNKSAHAAMTSGSPLLEHLKFSPVVEQLEDFVGMDSLGLTEYFPESGERIAYYPTLSLTEALLQVRTEKQATQFHYVPGNISRDLTASLRRRRASPVGLSRQNLFLGDLNHETHPASFSAHDSMFHGARDSMLPDPLPQVGGWIYDGLNRNLPPGRLREAWLNTLADSNLGEEEGTWNSFAEAVLHPLQQALYESQRGASFEVNRELRREISEGLAVFRKLLVEEGKDHPRFSDLSAHFGGKIERLSLHIDRVQRIAEEYRAAGVTVRPTFYDMAALDAIERIEAKFREPDYLEGSRDELRRKRVELRDADKVWFAQAADFAELIPPAKKALANVRDLTAPARPDHGQDIGLWEAAFERLALKADAGYDEAQQVMILEMPLNFMVYDLSKDHPELDFLRFEIFLNDLETHLDHRVQFIEVEGNVRRYRLPSLALVETLLETAWGEDRAQLHFVPGEISRDDTARLRGRRASPVGLSFSPLYNAEFKGPIHSFSFAQHDALDHASRDAQLEPGIPEVIHWLYQEIQKALPESPAKVKLLDELSDLDLPALSEDPWENLASRLATSAHHDYATPSESSRHWARLEAMVRDRFGGHPDLAPRQNQFLLEIRFARSQRSNFRGHRPRI